MVNLKDEMQDKQEYSGLDDSLKGARRATENESSSTPPNPEVAAMAQRRKFSSSEKHRILVEADACNEAGEIGALLRREGIYSSQLTTWRKQRAAAERASLEPQKRGRKIDPATKEARQLTELARENDRLRFKLAQARTIIDVQKKVCVSLGLPTDEMLRGLF